MPKTKSEEAKIDFSGNPFFSGKFPSLNIVHMTIEKFVNLIINISHLSLHDPS